VTLLKQSRITEIDSIGGLSSTGEVDIPQIPDMRLNIFSANKRLDRVISEGCSASRKTRNTRSRREVTTSVSTLKQSCICHYTVHRLISERLVLSGVASYGALGHVPPLDFQQFHFLVHFGVNLTANYPSIV